MVCINVLRHSRIDIRVCWSKTRASAWHCTGARSRRPALKCSRSRNRKSHSFPVIGCSPGDHVVEFVPAGSNKGLAVEQLMQHGAFMGRTPVFVGDDLTDEFGFDAANRLGGWSVLVGDRVQTSARFRVDGTADVHAWLQRNARRR